MKIWTRFPFVRLLFPLVAGILLYRIIPGASGVKLWPVISGCIALTAPLFMLSGFITYRIRWLFGVVLNLVLILLGFSVSLAGNQLEYRRHFSRLAAGDNVIYEAYLTELPAQRANSCKFVLEVSRIFVNGSGFPAKGYIIAYAGNDSLSASLDYGTVILFLSGRSLSDRLLTRVNLIMRVTFP